MSSPRHTPELYDVSPMIISDRIRPLGIFIHSFIANLFSKLSNIHNDIQYLENENAEVVQVMIPFQHLNDK